MVHPTDRNRTELCRIVLVSQLCRAQEKPQDLGIGPRCPSRKHVKQQEDQEPAGQAIQQVERCRAKTHGEEEKLPLRAKNREWAGERTVNEMDASCFRHGSPKKEQRSN